MIGVVFRKELKDALRDRRSLSMVLVLPLLGPLIFAGSVVASLDQIQAAAEDPLSVPVNGAERAPNLVAFLRSHDVHVRPPVDDPVAAASSKAEDLVLVIGEQFTEQFESARPAEVVIVRDESRREALVKVERLHALLAAYGRQVGQLRLRLHGVDPLIADAVFITGIDVSTPESRGALVVGIYVYFLMFSAFFGGFYIAIDCTAGERERRSLEPLLANPVPRWRIMTGKLLATLVIGLLSLLVAIAAFSFASRFVAAGALGIRINLGVVVSAVSFLLITPVLVIASSLQMIIAAFTRSFREAQTWLSFLVLVPMVPAVLPLLFPVKTQLWMMVIPIYSQALLIDSAIKGEAVVWGHVILSWLSTGLCGLILSLIAAQLYRRESLLFSD